jgi:hypothetical protein
VGTRYRLPGFPAAAGALLSLVANAACAEPPGVEVSNLELAVSVIAGRLSQHEGAGAGHALVQAVPKTVRDTADAAVAPASAPARGDVDAAGGGQARRTSLEDLVVEFLEKL